MKGEEEEEEEQCGVWSCSWLLCSAGLIQGCSGFLDGNLPWSEAVL